MARPEIGSVIFAPEVPQGHSALVGIVIKPGHFSTLPWECEPPAEFDKGTHILIAATHPIIRFFIGGKRDGQSVFDEFAAILAGEEIQILWEPGDEPDKLFKLLIPHAIAPPTRECMTLTQACLQAMISTTTIEFARHRLSVYSHYVQGNLEPGGYMNARMDEIERDMHFLEALE